MPKNEILCKIHLNNYRPEALELMNQIIHLATYFLYQFKYIL